MCPVKTGLGGLLGGNKGGSGKPIAYAKFPATEFADTSPSLKWIQLLPEPVENKIESPEKAGVLGFRATLVRADSDIDLKKTWKKKPKRRPVSHKIRAFVFQARDLPAADEDGMADPMVLAYSSIEKGDGVEKPA